THYKHWRCQHARCFAAKWLELFCHRSLGWKVRAYSLNGMEAKYLRLCRFLPFYLNMTQRNRGGQQGRFAAATTVGFNPGALAVIDKESFKRVITWRQMFRCHGAPGLRVNSLGYLRSA